MKFRTFRLIALFAGLTAVGGLVYLLVAPAKKPAPAVVNSAAPILAPPAPPTPKAPPPVTSPPAPPVPKIPEASVPAPAPAVDAATERIRAKIEQWLTEHPNRQGKMKQVDILPNEPFKATLVRFPEQDAVKWSNDPSQWSQVRIDLDRDGRDDEKWLLKNGHTYKRETLDPTGRVVGTSYFK
jgi:hypothetical protein